jgi:16S rRNA (guanine(966)-N(2))-methyltransferase RsmD
MGEVRLIGGRWKRSKLTVLHREGLRPTPDRVRETLFNWLGQHLDGWRVLDAFSGTGALGFEAASRGAMSVLCVERDPALVKAMLAAKARLAGSDALRAEVGDAISWMARAMRGSFDLVMLDPPFDAGLHARAIDHAIPLLASGGFLYVEAGERLTPPDRLVEYRHLEAGRVHAHLWRLRRDDEAVDTLPRPHPA